MSTEVRVPTLPESIADATVLSWHAKPGDAVSMGANLVDLETDKVVLEVPAPVNGVLGAIEAEDGKVVTANDLLATIEAGAAAAPAKPGNGESQTAPTVEAAPEEPVLTPAVRRLVKEHDLDPSRITGSGKDGRITKADVEAYLKSRAEAPTAPSPAEAPASAPAPLPGGAGDRPEQRVPMTRLRARVAERLVQAQQTAAILTTFNEVNLNAVNALRAKYKDQFEKEHEVRLGFMSFFVKAAVEALKKYPIINASVDGNDIIYHGYYDIGIAVASPRGLVVPILRDVDQMSFADVEKAIAGYGKKAKDGSLSYDELTGGTFSITNGGVFGSLLSTPILNPPQSAILGMHAIKERPVVENGEIRIGRMMYLALSYDHRIIDGSDAVRFLVSIKESLEDPARLLLNL